MTTTERPNDPGAIRPQTTEEYYDTRERPDPEPPELPHEVHFEGPHNGKVALVELSLEPGAWIEIDDENYFKLEAMA